MRKNLKEARAAAGLTQQQMADKLGISSRHYKYMEAGKIVGNVELWDILEDRTSSCAKNSVVIG